MKKNEIVSWFAIGAALVLASSTNGMAMGKKLTQHVLPQPVLQISVSSELSIHEFPPFERCNLGDFITRDPNDGYYRCSPAHQSAGETVRSYACTARFAEFGKSSRSMPDGMEVALEIPATTETLISQTEEFAPPGAVGRIRGIQHGLSTLVWMQKPVEIQSNGKSRTIRAESQNEMGRISGSAADEKAARYLDDVANGNEKLDVIRACLSIKPDEGVVRYLIGPI